MIDVGVLELHHPDGQVVTFEPGSLALAFAVTGPGTYDGPLALFQTLRRPSDLERWAADVVGRLGYRRLTMTSSWPSGCRRRSGAWPMRSSIAGPSPRATARS